MRRRLPSGPRVASLALVAAICCAVLGAGALQPAAAEVSELPDTPAGRCAAAYFAAFNSGDDPTVLAFLEEHRALSYLDAYAPDERLAHWERLRGIFGRLTPLRIALGLDLQLTLLADAAKTDGVLVMRFQLENEPPHRLAFLTYTGIDKAEVADEYVDYVATRAAPLDRALREATIKAVAQALQDQYVDPEIGRQMADTLLRRDAKGEYDDARKVGTLADRLTEDALAVSHDKHVWVEAQNPTVQESSDPVNRPSAELRRENYHFRKVEVLPGNLGYLKFDMIHDDDEALEIAAAALDSLAQCDALIFDIRDNIGGEWGTANLILGYLLPPGRLFGYMYDRDGRRVEERKTPDSVPGRPFDADVPVYVLTSERTGSAAEGFAYTLQSFHRATLAGEVTAGMAHPSKEVVVNDYFRVSVPYLRSENVVTGTSFEGTGVVPEIKVPADRALEAAVEDALRKIGNPE